MTTRIRNSVAIARPADMVFDYVTTPGLLFRLLNALLFRRRVAAESAEAVRRLKEVLELEQQHEVTEHASTNLQSLVSSH